MAFGLSAAAIGAIGSVGGALIGANATRNASKAQQSAADAASQLQADQYNQTRADNAGYRARGDSAGDRLAMLLGLDVKQPTAATEPGMQNQATFDKAAYLANNPDVAASGLDPWFHYITWGANEGRTFTPVATLAPAAGAATDPKANPLYGSLTRTFTGADLVNEPGYKFGLDQGNTSIERSASAKGGLYSGATLKALQRYGQDYGGTKFGEAFNRDRATKGDLFNMLSGVSGTGQIATNQVATAGANSANNTGNILMGNANAQGAAGLARGNILTGAINQGLSMWNRPDLAPNVYDYRGTELPYSLRGGG